MNEASSRYVDRIATEKLLQEKLRRVHHAPGRTGARPPVSLDDLDLLPAEPDRLVVTTKGGVDEVAFLSAVQTDHPENNRATARTSRAPHPRGDVVFLHGLYEDSVQTSQFFRSSLLERGFNVHWLTLPYHYERTPAESAFSGEFFWSADVDRSALAFKQAVCDLRQFHGYVARRADGPVWITGFSMGGGIALSLAARASMPGVFVINPVCNMSALVWEGALFAPIREDLDAHGLDFAQVKGIYQGFEPLDAPLVRTDRRAVVLARSLYDEINDPRHYDSLAARWGLEHVLSYKAGHLNILRVPRLAADFCHVSMGMR